MHILKLLNLLVIRSRNPDVSSLVSLSFSPNFYIVLLIVFLNVVIHFEAFFFFLPLCTYGAKAVEKVNV